MPDQSSSAPTPRAPTTYDEELLGAESHAILTTQSDPERIERVRRELETGFQALARIGPAVSIFGSARVDEEDPAYQLARRTAHLLGGAGFAVITGGGQETNAYVDLAIRFHYFYTRKVMFVRYAFAFVVFPGGFGTLDELYEALTLIQTGKIRHFPVVLVERSYWRGLMDWTRDRLLAEAKIAPEDLELMRLSDDPAEIVEIVEHYAVRQGLVPARG